jgi:hypothetical protein
VIGKIFAQKGTNTYSFNFGFFYFQKEPQSILRYEIERLLRVSWAFCWFVWSVAKIYLKFGFVSKHRYIIYI